MDPMLTEYRNPENSMLDFSRRIGRLFAEMTPTATEWPFNSLSGALPASNIWEDSKAYYIEMAAPGIDSDQIELSLVGNELTVTLNRPELEETDRTRRYIRRERFTQASSLGVTLPGSVDADQITADLENGILLIRLPKTADAQVKKIGVNTGK